MSTNAKTPRKGRWWGLSRGGKFLRRDGVGASGRSGFTHRVGKPGLTAVVKPITSATPTKTWRPDKHPKTGRGGFPSKPVKL